MRLAALAALPLLAFAAPTPAAGAEDVPAAIEACLAAPLSSETTVCLAEASLACGETDDFARCLQTVADRASAASQELIRQTPQELRPTLLQQRTAMRRICSTDFEGEALAQCGFTAELEHFEQTRRALQP